MRQGVLLNNLFRYFEGKPGLVATAILVGSSGEQLAAKTGTFDVLHLWLTDKTAPDSEFDGTVHGITFWDES